MDKCTTPNGYLSDEEIIELYWTRKENAIDETDKKYGQLLFKIAYNILNDRLDSEECQSDTYLSVWNTVPPTRPTVFCAFISSIARRIAINKYKEATRKKRIPSQLTISMEDLKESLHSDLSVEEEYSADELGKLINNYVWSLNKRQRCIFVGRFYMAEPIEELAKTLHIAVPTVYREIKKIKQGLKEYLIKNGVCL